MEIIDKRIEKRAAEAAKAAEPTVLEVVEERMTQATAAMLNGDPDPLKELKEHNGKPLTTYGDVVEFKKTVRGEKHKWKSIGFTAMFQQVGQAQLLMVRAAGLRTDEMLFVADYAIPPVWTEGDDSTAEARKRLETFLACACDREGRCKFHGEKCPGPGVKGDWLQSDIERLARVQGSPLPEAIEVLMKAEAARQKELEARRIVVPGR